MRILSALILCLMLAACAPRYVQDYDLFPPPTAAGKQCVTECTVAKERCEKECYQDALQCESTNNGNGGFGGGYGYGYGGGIYGGGIGTNFYPGRACTTSGCVQACRNNQLQCHTTCGGTIKERAPRCVSGCNGAVQPAPALQQ